MPSRAAVAAVVVAAHNTGRKMPVLVLVDNQDKKVVRAEVRAVVVADVVGIHSSVGSNLALEVVPGEEGRVVTRRRIVKGKNVTQ